MASAASPGGGPSLREIGACGTAPPRHACASLRRASLPLAGEGEGNSQRCAARIFAKRRRVRLPSHLARRPRRNPRARGTPGSRGTHGPWHLAAPRRPGREPGQCPGQPGAAAKSERGAANRKSAEPSASRARCLIGLLRRTPGGLTFQAPSPFSFGCSTCPPLSGPSSTWRSVPRYGAASDGPRVMRGWRIGTLRLGPPRADLRTRRAATAPIGPGVPAPIPEVLAAHLRRRLRPSPHLSALERALG